MMRKLFKSMVRPIIRRAGFDIIRYRKTGLDSDYPLDFSSISIEICDIVKPYTMTSPERIDALINAVQYVVKNEIDGAMVECGVWKGGSSMAMALTLKKLGVENRDLYLYDTFSGMTGPSDVDISIRGATAHKTFSETKISEDASNWCLSPLEEVKENVFSTGYKKEKFHFIKGKVEETIPKNIPEKIALLRLDTDWYQSTKHELTHLFPLLKPNGVLIIDDYGYWEGARKAVDEYISDNNIQILLNRIDYTGRIAVKT
jgi:O-methyltransferase